MRLPGYTVPPLNGQIMAVPADALTLGHGLGAFEVVVDRVVDMGDHRYVLGAVGDSRISVRVPAAVPAPTAGHACRNDSRATRSLSDSG
jgi:hypothetical protein